MDNFNLQEYLPKIVEGLNDFSLKPYNRKLLYSVKQFLYEKIKFVYNSYSAEEFKQLYTSLGFVLLEHDYKLSSDDELLSGKFIIKIDNNYLLSDIFNYFKIPITNYEY